MSDAVKVAKVISVLCEAFRQKPTEAMFAAYQMGLGDLPVESVEAAAQRAIRTCKFMPTVAELRELAGEPSVKDRALLAYDAAVAAASKYGAYRSPDFDDPTINATIRHIGGWVDFCDSPADCPFWRKRFLDAYEVFYRRGVGDEQSAPLAGLHERSNRLLGYERDTRTEVRTGLPQSTTPKLDDRDDKPPRITQEKPK